MSNTLCIRAASITTRKTSANRHPMPFFNNLPCTQPHPGFCIGRLCIVLYQKACFYPAKNCQSHPRPRLNASASLFIWRACAFTAVLSLPAPEKAGRSRRSALRIEARDRNERLFRIVGFLDQEMGVGHRGDLREVRDAQDLTVLRDHPEFLRDDVGDPPLRPVSISSNTSVPTSSSPRRSSSERQHDPRRLSPDTMRARA